MTAKTATPMPSANLQAYVKCCADRDRLKSDRTRLMIALDNLIECVTRPELFHGELDSARSLLRELEEGK